MAHSSTFFGEFSSVLQLGAERTLLIEDLVNLPKKLNCYPATAKFSARSIGAPSYRFSALLDESEHLNAAFFNVLWASFKGPFCILGIYKLLITLLSFGAPVLIGIIVEYIESYPNSTRDIIEGVYIVAAVFAVLLLSAVMNTYYNVRAGMLQLEMKAALTHVVFSKALAYRVYGLKLIDMTDAQIANVIQVDVERVCDCVKTLHDLWALPLQIVVAFALLYLQVKFAFLAGICIILFMLPVNTVIAKRIGKATVQLMKHKDKKLQVLSESTRSMKGIKMFGWEDVVFRMSNGHRELEMSFLAQQKYLDAVCVFLWACLPVIVPFATLATAILSDQQVTAAKVFTTLALLGLLIIPMNAFPWVVNGVMEAKVSHKRIAKLCLVATPNASTAEAASNKVTQDSTLYKSVANAASGGAWFLRLFSDGDHVGQADVPNPVNPQASPDSLGPGTAKPLFALNRIGFTVQQPNVDVTINQLLPSDGEVRGPYQMELHPGSLMAVIGPIASGKSFFLLGCIGELRSYQWNPFDEDSGSITEAGHWRALQSKEDELLPPTCSSGAQCEQSGSLLNVEHVSFTETLFSFCPQVPVIHSDTVRHNILFGSPYVEERYVHVVSGCCLEQDMQRWAYGDKMNVGPSGCKLSGGQRLRIGIARAIYANSSVIVLDDPFSALDIKTASSIRDYIMKVCSIASTLPPFSTTNGENGTWKRRSVIVSTHTLSLLQDCADGEWSVIELPSPSSKVPTGVICPVALKSSDCLSVDKKHTWMSGEDSVEVLGCSDDKGKEQEELETIVEEEEKECDKEGAIAPGIYKDYLVNAGKMQVAVILISTFLMQASANGITVYIAMWASTLPPSSAGPDIASRRLADWLSRKPTDYVFLEVLGVLVVFNVCAALVRSFSFAAGGLSAARNMYNRLIQAVVFAPQTFFDTNAIGRILNRLGKDSNCIDDQLPFMLNIVLAQLFMLLGSIVTILYTCPFMLVLLLLVAILYYRLQKFYRRSSRELRRLDSVSRSPVYSLMCDCVVNAVTIHTLQKEPYFSGQLGQALDVSLRVSYNSLIAQQWLGIRLQCLGISISCSICVLAFVSVYYDIFPMSASLIGVSLLCSFNIVSNLTGLVGSLAESEQNMISVERVMEYVNMMSTDICEDNVKTAAGDAYPEVETDLESALTVPLLQDNESSATDDGDGFSKQVFDIRDESDYGSFHITSQSFHRGLSDSHLDKGDLTGDIEFRQASLYYPSTCSSLTLEVGCVQRTWGYQSLSLSLPAGTRAAVVGRTGSGKSSLVLSLLGLYPYTGSIQLSGHEICAPLNPSKKSTSDASPGRQWFMSPSLRKCICVVPQDSVVFTGSVRFNVDPCGDYTDTRILEALESSGFSRCYKSAKGLPNEQYLNCELKHGGSELSQGQRHLLCLARIFVRNHEDIKCVLLDEPSAAMDMLAQEVFYTSLMRWLNLTSTDSNSHKPFDAKEHNCHGLTLLIVCHKLDTLKPGLCNKVIRMEDGKLVSCEDLDTAGQSVVTV